MTNTQSDVIAQLEQSLLGDSRAYNRLQVAEKAGVSLDRAVRLWRSLGFPSVADEQEVFGDCDVEALTTISAMVDTGIVDEHSEAALARSLGQAMARLADWQTTMLADLVYRDDDLSPTSDETVKMAIDLVPVMERLQTYVWHRHLIAAAARLLPVAADDPLSDTMVAGFADIVGFTKLSRSISEKDLADLVEQFESTTAGIIAEHDGRVVKTIGDEVMFVVKDTTRAADIALALMNWTDSDDDLPKLRVGMAHGRVISWLGDVYGPIVNVASRLTSVARPGTTVVDRDLALSLKDQPDYTLRRLRRVSVRGYSHLEPWALRSSV